MSLPEDTWTTTEAGAAAYERLRGFDESLYEPYGFTEVRTPYCSRCEGGTKAYVCGPCQRAAEREQLEQERNEEWWDQPATREDTQ